MLMVCATMLVAQDKNDFTIQSLDGAIRVHVVAGAKLEWTVQHEGQQIIAPSALSMQLEGGDVLGDNATIASSKTELMLSLMHMCRASTSNVQP